MSPEGGRRYRFGPLERRGLIAGWRGGQIAAVCSGLVMGIIALRSRPTVVTVLAAVVAVAGGVALAWWPVAGRTGEEWLPTVVRWGTKRRGGRRFLAGVAGDGHHLCPDGRHCSRSVAGPGSVGGVGEHTARSYRRPPWRRGCFGHLEVLSASSAEGGVTGVVADRRARTYTATLEVRGHSFALLGASDKDRRVEGWAGVLGALARERSLVHRLQWVASTIPDDGTAVGRYLEERGVLASDSPARHSYVELLSASGAATCRHDVLLAVQVRAAGPGSRAVRAAGGGDTGACTVLLRELASLGRHLLEADVTVERVLDPGSLEETIRRAGAPFPTASGSPGRQHPGRLGRDVVPDPPCAPCAVGWPWPLATEEEWACIRTDGTWQVTYWIAEWPRVDVGPDFLGPLLLGSVRRTVAVVMEPVSPSRAVREAQQARTADIADAELRRRAGFLSTARRTREAELAGRREEELADGHASFRFCGYVTVTAASKDDLLSACEATEQAAGQCRVELRRLYGQQEQGFLASLPLASGLA